MFKRVCGFLIGMALLILTAVPAFAEDKVTGNVSAGVFSNYVFRGIKLSESWVVQPSITVNYKGFSANMWSNIDPDFGDELETTETDYTLGYSKTFDKLTLTGGLVYYGLEGIPDTQEVFITGAYAGMLNPSLSVYYDYDEGTGFYVQAAVSHTVNITGKIPLTVGALAGYVIDNGFTHGLDHNGHEIRAFYNGQVSAAVSIPSAKNISLTPQVAYSFPLSNKGKEAVESLANDGDSSVLYGGVAVTFGF
jgi:hypothetical protein